MSRTGGACSTGGAGAVASAGAGKASPSATASGATTAAAASGLALGPATILLAAGAWSWEGCFSPLRDAEAGRGVADAGRAVARGVTFMVMSGARRASARNNFRGADGRSRGREVTGALELPDLGVTGMLDEGKVVSKHEQGALEVPTGTHSMHRMHRV